ncbi:glycosyltransferase [Rosistilla oblonga]|uniref:glycosyltransferase n=1 Tax=Rosistilla oblonga TaxID=2527990 RepID=UPI003A96EE95
MDIKCNQQSPGNQSSAAPRDLVKSKKLDKILIVQNKIPHYRKAFYNALAQHYDVHVIHSGEASRAPGDLYRESVVRVRSVGPFRFQSNVLREVTGGEYLATILMFDIRWCNGFLSLIRGTKSRVLLWGHRYSDSWLANKVRTGLMPYADGMIQYGGEGIARMVVEGTDPAKIFVAQNTIEVLNHADGSSERKSSFLFVGRAQKRKKVDQLLYAFAEVVNSLPSRVTIDIVGAGGENDRLACLAKELGISDRVIFHGAITDETQLKRLFHRSFAYVSPGPVGLGVLHSLAYGVPVVTGVLGKHGPEFEHLREGSNAILFRSTAELSRILTDLSHSPRKASSLGKNAYEHYLREGLLAGMVEGFIQAIENRPQVQVNAKENAKQSQAKMSQAA